MPVPSRLISLLTKVRDPDPAVLRAVLEAVRALRIPQGWSVEHLVVDGCDAELSAQEPLMGHLLAYPAARVVRVAPKGVALAQAMGVRHTNGALVVNVDDDNVLAPDYLEQVVAQFEADPKLGTLGSGWITVRWTDTAPSWADDDRVRELFQHRRILSAECSDEPHWKPFWPPGTGLVYRREVAERFRAGVEEGAITFAVKSDRPPQGGDDFILHWLALQAGMKVGATPALKVEHLIPSDRLAPLTLRKMMFVAIHGGALAHAAIYPEHYRRGPPVHVLARQLAQELVPLLSTGAWTLAGVRLSMLAAGWRAGFEVRGTPVPAWLVTLERRLGVRQAGHDAADIFIRRAS